MSDGRRWGGFTVAWLALPLLLTACGGDSSSGPSSSDSRFLFQHNARFNDGRTVRWPNLPIRVFLNDIARTDEVNEWAGVTGGRVTFTFVGSRSGANITFTFGTGDDICGVTTVEYNTNGEILSADVRVVQGIFRGPQCVRTVVHEVGHAIGFLDHTADGGLMDTDGGNGELTDPVARMMTTLYSMAPGTSVSSAQVPRAEQRAGGRRVITIVDPVRR